MRSKNRKGFAPLVAIGIIALATVVVMAFTPIGTSIASAVFNIPVPCESGRYNPSCICGEGYKKIEIISGGGWTCEREDSVLNPESLTYEEEAIAYAKQRLMETFPDCDSIECLGNSEIIATVGQGWDGNRVALVECTDSSQGITFWTINPDIEDGSFTKAKCVNYYEKPSGVNDASMRIDNVIAWDEGRKIQIEGYFTSLCEYAGSAEASIIYTLPETRGDFVSIIDVISGIPCTVSTTSRTAEIKCTKECGAGGGGPFKVKAEITGTYCMAKELNGNDIKISYDNIVCVEDGEWLSWRCSDSTNWFRYARYCLSPIVVQPLV